jgi:hypothetical protein
LTSVIIEITKTVDGKENKLRSSFYLGRGNKE